MINERMNLDNKKYVLIDKHELQCKYFKELNTYIPKLLHFLWEKPTVISEILNNADPKDVKNNLASLITNNFYENIVSSNYIEDNLILVITLLLKKEVNNLNSMDDPEIFLQETPCGYVLEHLKEKIDIKNFFKNIILDVVEKLEVVYSSTNINFNVKEIQEKYQKMKEELEKKFKKTGKKQKILDKSYYRNLISNVFNEYTYDDDEEESGFIIPKDTIDTQTFNSKYIPDLTKSELENQVNECKENEMKNYLNILINNCETNDNFYSNQKLLQNIFESPISKEVLASYQIDFSKVLVLIDKLFVNLLNDLYLLPYSVKCICKIILELIKKKFPQISSTQLNSFIAKFFFTKLFSPIFENPHLSALIDNFIISGVTKHNAVIINQVINKLVSGKLFQNSDEKESDYTPFNWYFIDKMPEVLKFFESITKVTLPSFVEKIINDQLSENYELNYFDENKNEVIFHRSICFTLKDLCALLESMKKSSNIIFNDAFYTNARQQRGLKATFEKLISESSNEVLEKLKSNIEYEIVKIHDPKNKKNQEKEVQGREIQYYFLISDLVTNEKYTELFNIKQEKANFNLKESKQSGNESEITNNNIIKVKNYFCSLLYNYRTLVETDFDEGTTSNTLSILNELKKFIKSSNFVIDGSIPSEWYVTSLLEYLKKIPKNLTENDCKNLYLEIEDNINNSIKGLDFEALSVILEKAKFAKRIKINYNNSKQNILNIDLNEKVQSIIEKEIIPVIINYKYNKNEKEFSIEESHNQKEIQMHLAENLIFDDNKKLKKNFCTTVKMFTKKFPDLNKAQQLHDKTLKDMNDELKITEKLTSYFEIIKKFINKTQNITNEKEIESINDKIYDYVMEKIYEKIYPVEPDPKDYQVFRKCVLLSWAEPKNFIAKKTNYVFDSFLPDVIGFFKKIDNEKSPRQKFLYMRKIFKAINDVVKFNGGDDNTGVDDQMPILNYAFVKARPLHICSNCGYMKLFIGKNKNREEGSQLTQLSGICDHVIQLGYELMLGVTKEEFDEKCKIAQFEKK